MELADLMHTEVLSVGPDTTMAEAARRMVERDTGAAVVLDDGELVGLVSERDLMRVVSDGVDPQVPVSDRMTRHVLTGVPSMGIPEALAIMHEGRFRHLPGVRPRRRRRHGLDARRDGVDGVPPAPRRLARGRRRRRGRAARGDPPLAHRRELAWLSRASPRSARRPRA